MNDNNYKLDNYKYNIGTRHQFPLGLKEPTVQEQMQTDMSKSSGLDLEKGQINWVL